MEGDDVLRVKGVADVGERSTLLWSTPRHTAVHVNKDVRLLTVRDRQPGLRRRSRLSWYAIPTNGWRMR